MSDAFSFVFYVFGKIVSFIFSEDVVIEYGYFAVSAGYVLVAISVLSLVIGSVLSFSSGRAITEGYSRAHGSVDHMAHSVNHAFKSRK